MGIRAIKSFSVQQRIKLLIYILAVKAIDRTPEILKRSYNFVLGLEAKSIKVFSRRGKIHFEYPIGENIYKFSLNEASSDTMVFTQIVINEEYKVIVDLFEKLKIIPRYIIDAGANIGMTSLYLKHFFPDAFIIAVEPNTKTFNDLKENINNNEFHNIELINKGLWNKETFLKADYSFRDRQSWAFRLEESAQKEDALFEATTVLSIVRDFNFPKVDFLKIDIEGGEKQLFSGGDYNWLDLINIVAIEIHDEFTCRENIENILRDKGFEISYSGELTIGISKTLQAS